MHSNALPYRLCRKNQDLSSLVLYSDDTYLVHMARISGHLLWSPLKTGGDCLLNLKFFSCLEWLSLLLTPLVPEWLRACKLGSVVAYLLYDNTVELLFNLSRPDICKSAFETPLDWYGCCETCTTILSFWIFTWGTDWAENHLSNLH